MGQGQEVSSTELIQEIAEQVEKGRITESDRRELVKVGKVSKYTQDPLSKIGTVFKVRGWVYGTYNRNPKRTRFFAKVHRKGEEGDILQKGENFIANGWVYQVYDIRSRGRVFVRVLGVHMPEVSNG